MGLIEILRRRSMRREYLNRDDRNFVSRWARPPSKNTAEWLEMFSKSPRLAVVDRIASDLANVNGRLFRVNPDGTETEITEHPFLDFMAQPNPLYEMTSSAIWRLHEIYLMLTGEGFFLIERDERDRPVELWNVPPHWVKMTPYLGSPTYQIISPGGISMEVPVDDMFLMKQLNPLDPFMRGLGIAESIADEVEIDEYAAKFQKRFFYNDATPPVVFAMPTATDEQREAFMARWNKRHKGVENSHKAAALSGEITIHELGKGEGKNLGFIESREAMRDAVLEHFGVPREIMGITENSNRATADSAQYIYAKNVLMPRLRNREEAINKQLLPLFGDDLVWRFDPVIPYDKEFDKAVALEGWDKGLLTKNEARAKLDLGAVEGGDIFKTTSGDVFMRETDDAAALSQAAQQAEPVAEPPDTGKAQTPALSLLPSASESTIDTPGVSDFGDVYFDRKAEHRVNISAMLRKEDQLAQESELLFEHTVTQYFNEQQTKIAQAIGLTEKALPDALSELEPYLLPDGTFDPELWTVLTEAEQRQLTAAVAAGLLNWDAEAKKLTELFRPLWKKAYDDGAALSAESYGIFGIDKPEFVTPAKINGGKRVVGIQQTTQKAIADIIAAGIANGTSQSELKKAIQSEMGTTKSRAKLIARQETATALATGQFDMMRNAGAKTKTWHHRDQRDPRDGTNGKVNHVILEGETVPIDGVFSNGLRYPRDPDDGRPEQLINCRCYLTYGGF